MGQLDQNWDKVLDLFYNYPSKSFQVREIGRLSKVSKTTVQRILDDLLKKKIIILKRGAIYKNYTASVHCWKYVFLKKTYFVQRIYESGLVDYLQAKLHPHAIILFGSGAKGDYVAESDIDIFIEVERKSKSIEKKITQLTESFYKSREALLLKLCAF